MNSTRRAFGRAAAGRCHSRAPTNAERQLRPTNRNAVAAFSPALADAVGLRWVNGRNKNNSEGVVATQRRKRCNAFSGENIFWNVNQGSSFHATLGLVDLNPFGILRWSAINGTARRTSDLPQRPLCVAGQVACSRTTRPIARHQPAQSE